MFDLYLIRFLADFAGFHGFTWISRLHNPKKYQKLCFLEIYEASFGSWTRVVRVIYVINLTSQKQYVIALEWIWLVMVSGDSPEIISSLVLLYLEITRPKHQKSNKNKCQLAIKEQTQPQKILTSTSSKASICCCRTGRALRSYKGNITSSSTWSI